MNILDADLALVKSLEDQGVCYLNWCDGGCAKVVRDGAAYHVFEITAYGISENFTQTVSSAEDVIELAYSFT